MKKYFYLLLFVLTLGFVKTANAEELAVILTGSKIYEEPKATGYVAKNMDDREVTVEKGMVFKILDKANGWDIVEYSPGLRGYIMETVMASSSDLSDPLAGGYNPSNNPSVVVNISEADGVWTLSENGHNYKGIRNGKVVVFVDSKNQIAYSLVAINGNQIVYGYDNSLTKFF